MEHYDSTLTHQDTVPCCTVPCHIYCTVPYHTILHSIIPFVWYGHTIPTMLHSTIPRHIYCSVPYHAISCHTAQHHTTDQYHTMPYCTLIPCHTVPYSIQHSTLCNTTQYWWFPQLYKLGNGMTQQYHSGMTQQYHSSMTQQYRNGMSAVPYWHDSAVP